MPLILKERKKKHYGVEDLMSLFKAAMDKAGYTDQTREQCSAQMAHESGNFRYDEEIHDVNYRGGPDLGNSTW